MKNWWKNQMYLNIINHGDQKKDFIVIKTLEPKYNRFVFFDGYEFPHGMNICTDRYFGEEYRKNQVFFFDNPEFLEELEEEDDYDD